MLPAWGGLEEPRPWLAVLTWAWVVVAVGRVWGVTRVAQAAALALALGGAAAWLVPAGPLEPYHHGVELWSAIVDPRDRTLLPDAKHGAAHLWPARWAWLLGLDEALLGFVGAAYGVLAACALFDAVAGLAGAEAGVLAAVALLVSPLHLRVGLSLSSFTAAELGACLIAAGLVRRRAGAPAGVWLAAGGAALAACSRAEWQVLGPLLWLLGLTAVGPRPAWRDLAPLGAMGAVATAHLAATLGAGAQDNLGHPDAGALVGVLVVLAAVVGVALTTRAVGARLGGVSVGVGAVVLTAAAAAELLAWPARFDGRAPPLDAGAMALARVHASLHPAFASPVVAGAAIVGAGLAAGASAQRAAVVGGWWVAAIGMYAGLATWDNLSTYLRGSLGVGWLVAGLAGVGLRAVAPRGGVGVLAGAGLVALGAAPRWSVAAHRWADADELAVLRAARVARADGQRVFAPLPEDLPAPRALLWEEERAYVGAGLLAPADDPWLRPGGEALADPAAAVGGLWVVTLSCYRLAPPHPEDADDAVGAGGRIWRGVDRHALTPPWPDKPPAWPLAGVPCWDQPERAVANPDGTWSCPRGTTPSGRGYEDPLCAAMRTTFELEGIAGVAVAPGELSGPHLHVLAQSPVIGVYRVVGARAAPPVP